ncbi:hypothetical protein NS220_12180 [Microbacterium testaceum]|uniref:Uncharacterized protein n=1 Tax=Microbacterium testaceum TaxID=2033 RepID=A0A147EVK0_MICTE|nr:DUF6264 family protein [Microbacterium testaceum]KTR93498.1 hypothetical protein NS220_12180 [Microbacterium testaceum]
MSDADPRPRPQFGEYATPEEQQARIQRPEVTEALDAGVAPQETSPVPKAAAPVPARGPLVDRIITVMLLVYGLVSVVTTIAQVLDFPNYAEQAARILDVDATYSNLTAGFIWGAVAAVVYGVTYLLTALFTVRRLRRGRISFWIPLVGFAVAAIVGGTCITIAIVNDPQYLSALMGGIAK